MRTEQQVLKISLVAILVFSALGITFGLVSGSSAIIFDGAFSLVDALMSLVSIMVAGLIARSVSQELSPQLRQRFSVGFWHFEPVVLAINALLLMAIAGYALFQSIMVILSGGRDIQFGPAVVYAGIILVLTSVVATVEYRANRTLQSSFIEMDIKGWVMAGGVTAALLIAFVIGFFIDDTQWDWLTPYVDPAVLAIVALVLIPIPFGTLRKAVSQLALIAPEPLRAEIEAIAERTVEAHGYIEARVYCLQMGRSRQAEIVFQVPPGAPPLPLEAWDDVRESVIREIAGDDPHSWITVSFTSRRDETVD